MRRTYLLLAAVALVALAVVPAVAFGNAGVHGNYTMNTDACAGCHRAHTAPSSITWNDRLDGTGADHSALLLSDATNIEDFCMTCHDTAGQGAETNVEGGVYNADIGGAYGVAGQPLNGGAFGRETTIAGVPTRVDYLGNAVTSVHSAPGGWTIFGGGAYATTTSVNASGGVFGEQNWGGPVISYLSCDTCHDVHGTSNYRILKDKVWGNTVGGYAAESTINPTPTPFVVSCEPGYPTAGFRLHHDYMADGYVPNYTTPLYAKPMGNDVNKGMVGWCSGCHTMYSAAYRETTYSAGDSLFWDDTLRHRHPQNVALSTWTGPNSLIITDSPLPFAHDPVAEANGAVTKRPSDWIECLTCHKAHGTSAVMTGFANVADSRNPNPNTGDDGVPPDSGSGLLRLDNRGVCEECHNK